MMETSLKYSGNTYPQQNSETCINAGPLLLLPSIQGLLCWTPFDSIWNSTQTGVNRQTPPQVSHGRKLSRPSERVLQHAGLWKRVSGQRNGWNKLIWHLREEIQYSVKSELWKWNFPSEKFGRQRHWSSRPHGELYSGPACDKAVKTRCKVLLEWYKGPEWSGRTQGNVMDRELHGVENSQYDATSFEFIWMISNVFIVVRVHHGGG